MLEDLERDRENVDRLLEWFEAFQELSVGSHWRIGLNRIARRPNQYGQSLGSALPSLVESLRNALLPRVDRLRAWSKERESTWLAGDRTVWDNYLGMRFFDEAGMASSTYFVTEMQDLEYITWWRCMRGSLSKEERDLSHLEVQEMVKAPTDGVPWDIPEADIALRANSPRDLRELQFDA